MTQYNIRPGDEASMWLKYKGNVRISWNSFDVSEGITTDISGNRLALPWRVMPTEIGAGTYIDLFLSVESLNWNFKKAELDMDFMETYSTEGDDGEGMKLQSKDAAKVNNGVTIKGYLESDTWRNERPVWNTSDDSLFWPALSLPQKQQLLINMVKRSGVQDVDAGKSYEVHPLKVVFNLGYRQDYWEDILDYLKNDLGYTYTQARKEIQEKWMPGFVRTWDNHDAKSWTRQVILNGGEITDDGNTYVISGRPIAERVEYGYLNCVLDSVRMMESASRPNRIPVELTVIFDTNNNRWYANNDLKYTRSQFNAFGYGNFKELAPREARPGEYW